MASAFSAACRSSAASTAPPSRSSRPCWRRNRRPFREVVLVEFPRTGMWSIGFITGVTEGEVQELADEEVLNVYLPTTPNPTSGFLCFVPRSEVYPLSMTVEEGIKLVVSGGLVIPPDRRPPEKRKKPPPVPVRLVAE